MVDSSRDMFALELGQQAWDTAHAEELKGALSDIRYAVADACVRRDNMGRPGGSLKTVIEVYHNTRTWYGARRYKPQTRNCTMWSAGHLFGSLWIGVDDQLYILRAPSDEDRRKGQLFGMHVLSDDEIIFVIDGRDLRYVYLFIEDVDKLWVDGRPQVGFPYLELVSPEESHVVPGGGTTTD